MYCHTASFKLKNGKYCSTEQSICDETLRDTKVYVLALLPAKLLERMAQEHSETYGRTNECLERSDAECVADRGRPAACASAALLLPPALEFCLPAAPAPDDACGTGPARDFLGGA